MRPVVTLWHKACVYTIWAYFCTWVLFS